MQLIYRTPFVTMSPLVNHGQKTTYPKGFPNWSSLNQSVQELWSTGTIELVPLSPGFFRRLFLVSKATWQWKPIINLNISALSVFVHWSSLLWRRLGQSSGPYMGNKPCRHKLRFMYASVMTAPHGSLPWSQPESIYQDAQTSSSLYPPLPGEIARLPGRPADIPRDLQRSSLANILAQSLFQRLRSSWILKLSSPGHHTKR